MEIEQLNIFCESTTQWFSNTLGKPTKVQEKAWPAIAKGQDTLVVAPTGTGKTLSAFLVFIDQLMEKASRNELEEELQLIYISPLKSLAGDIRENLNKPLAGIQDIGRQNGEHSCPIKVALRTGDTTQAERRNMIKHPPHILITTPESLYLLLTSKSGKGLLHTAKAVIIDELHALIDTKRGAHLMLSIARLDALCQTPLQRIGLSATIQPLEVAANYLSPQKAVIVAPKMSKRLKLFVTSPLSSDTGIVKKTIWEELARKVYDQCLRSRSVIAFVEGRRFAEKLAYYVNELGGEGFARTHHGSMSKEQRFEVEQALRDGQLRLLCATSSMELGIDVGEIDQVFQIGCPRSISSTLQRLGRAGHNPRRVSTMQMFPRVPIEGLYCGITAEVAKKGMVETCKPPKHCLDVLAQHLVSMATGDGYEVADVMPILKRTYNFAEVTEEELNNVLCMLAGDYEHDCDIPVRPRILYDRIHQQVHGDVYSRMLAISAAGTIPDRGMYTVKSQDGVKLGELDEEFVFEARVGEKFLLGTFSWRIDKIDKDSVIVSPSSTTNAKLPFWKGDMKGRGMQTGIAFGSIFRELNKAADQDKLFDKLSNLGLDEACAQSAEEFLKRQIQVTQVLPDDQTIVVEHFKDETGNYQLMVHSVFGRQINEPLAFLALQTAKKLTSRNIMHVDDDDGFLLFPYDGLDLPEGLMYQISPIHAEQTLEAVLLSTPIFNMIFRYNAARALMMGVRNSSRQPLWVQRMKSAQMLDALIRYPDHPLMVETKRECLENYWDVKGVIRIIKAIQTGAIKVHEVSLELPSPMSYPFRQQSVGAMMYDYAPSTLSIQTYATELLEEADMIVPAPEELERVSLRT
ncbi:MAG: DEAD/DEAH box helicase, partial [Clostridiales bacterium]|nr:DEAD/DEAH box helicase [Clostridiales bacterium]